MIIWSVQPCKPACGSFTASYYSFVFQRCKQPNSSKGNMAICTSEGGGVQEADPRFSGVRRSRQRCCATCWLTEMEEAAERLLEPQANISPLLSVNQHHSQNKERRPAACRCHSDGCWLRHGLGAAALRLGAEGRQSREVMPAEMSSSHQRGPSSPSQVCRHQQHFYTPLLLAPAHRRLWELPACPQNTGAKPHCCSHAKQCDMWVSMTRCCSLTSRHQIQMPSESRASPKRSVP